jgi:uncharacterized protein
MSNSIPAALHTKMLQLIILPTEKCNFRCTYCYEDFAIGKLKRPVINGIKNLITARLERDSLDVLTLSWFGGEPLLAKEIMYEIAEHAHEQHQAGRLKVFGGDVTTNAYLLTPTVLKRLCALKQNSYQVSLDGWEDGHNQTRKYASGEGTFDPIWRNLLDAQQTAEDFRITLRLHLTRENEASMNTLVDNVVRQFGKDPRFNVFFKTIENLGGPKAGDIKTVNKTTAAKRSEVLVKLTRDAGMQTTAVIDGPESNTGAGASSGAGVQLATEEKKAVAASATPGKYHYEGYICYAAKPNSLMIRADGSIGKCTVLMHDPRNRIGQINEDGTMVLDSALVNKVWMRGFVSGKPMELGCPAQNLPKYEAPLVKLEQLTVKAKRPVEVAA